jgi:hypothetical protein
MKIAFCLGLIGLSSCGFPNRTNCSSGSNVRIINRSGNKASIELSAENSTVKLNMTGSQIRKDTMLCFDKVPKTDGHYTVKVKSITLDSATNFGYYTNGYPLSSRLEIIIDKARFTASEVFDR